MSEQFLPNENVDLTEMSERQEATKEICEQVLAEVDSRFHEAYNDSSFDDNIPAAERRQLFSSYTYFGRECDTLRMTIPHDIRLEQPEGGVDTRAGVTRITIRKPIDLSMEIYSELHPLARLAEVDGAELITLLEAIQMYEEAILTDENGLLDNNEYTQDDGPSVDDLTPEEVDDCYGFLTENDPPETDEETTFAVQEHPLLLINLHRDNSSGLSGATKVTIGVFGDSLRVMDITDPWRVSSSHSAVPFMPHLISYIKAGELIEVAFDHSKKIGETGDDGSAAVA